MWGFTSLKDCVMPETYTPSPARTGTWTEEEIRQQPGSWMRSLSHIDKSRQALDGFLTLCCAKTIYGSS